MSLHSPLNSPYSRPLVVCNIAFMDGCIYPGNQRGAVAVVVAAVLVVLLGIGALAVDLAHLYVVRNELQNGADATALAGAQCLYKRNANCGNVCVVSSTNACPLPDWTTATNRANTAKSLNKTDNVTLSNATIDVGYWDATGANGFQPSSLSPVKVTDFPALRVTVDRSAGSNGGAVATWFAALFGVNSAPVSAQAVAMVSGTSIAGAGSLFPLTMSQCMFSKYWVSATNQPLLVSASDPNIIQVGNKYYLQTPDGNIEQTIGQPYTFWITSSYHAYSNCEAGQWTTLGDTNNSSSNLSSLIAGTTPSTQIGVGDPAWLATGTMTSLYKDVKACMNTSCEYVNIAVVNTVNGGTSQPVLAFACLHITDSVGGSGKYVQVELSNGANCPPISNTGGGTPGPINYGQTTPPRLAL